MIDNAVAAGMNVVDTALGAWLTRRATLTGERTALVDDTRSVTYAELEERATRLADALRSRGVRRGDRVAMLMVSDVSFMEVMLAVAKAGAVFVPVNVRLGAPEVAHLLADSGADVLVWSAELAPVAAAARCTEGVRVRVGVQVGGSVGDGVFEMESLLESGSSTASMDNVSGVDLAALMYTSGTTGRPKGVMLTHDNLWWNVVNGLSNGRGYLATDCTVTVAPLFHIGALGGNTLPLLYVGAKNVIQRSFEPGRLLTAMQDQRVTMQFLVPAMWSALVSECDVDSYDLSALQVAITGGAPCPRPVLDYFQQRGVSFREGFGMTEAAPGISSLDDDNVRRKAGSIGRPSFYVHTRIVDEADRDVSPGDVGELAIRGPNVFRGYWGMPAETAEAFRGGWFHTGDLVRADDEGFMYIVDRKKDVIISGGENIHPAEVEQVLIAHPDVLEVAVVAGPHPRWGETPVAVVALTAGASVTEAQLISYTRDRLAHFKCPTAVRVVTELPRNASGKVLKAVLRSELPGAPPATAR